MRLKELTQKLSLQVLTPEVPGNDPEIAGGYVSDLLSDVLAHAPKNGILVTVQVHLNVIAVAVHAELAAIVFGSGRVPDDAVKAKAVEEGVALYGSEKSAFDIVGRLYELGVRGPQE